MLSENEVNAYLQTGEQLKRVDPIDCNCTDCIIGHSCPFNRLTDAQLIGLVRGEYQDATGYCHAEIIDEARERNLIEQDSSS